MDNSSRLSVDIETFLRWVYVAQKADVVVESGAGLYPIESEWAGDPRKAISGDGVCQVLDQVQLGTRVDGGSRGNGAIHSDALMAHLIVKQIASDRSDIQNAWRMATVVEHARRGDRPDFLPGVKPLIRPAMTARRTVKMRYDQRRNPVACELEVVVSAEYITFIRSLYTEWRFGVFQLFERLKNTPMKRFCVEWSDIPERPWIA
jgi:hypothetical protein